MAGGRRPPRDPGDIYPGSVGSRPRSPRPNAAPRDYAEEYRRRVERKLGMSMEAARERGLSFQAARGHRPREKRFTEERIERGLFRPPPGRLTDTDRRFLRRQNYRLGPRPADRDRFREAERAYRELSPEQRERIRDQAARLARGYSANKRRTRRAGGGRRRAAGGGRGGGGGFEHFEYDLYEDFDFEDEFPDIDDPLAVLLFYHESAV